MAYASIDVDGMTLMISRLEITADRLHHTFQNLYSRVSRAGIDTRDLSQIGEIAAWIDDELPGLRRRLNLAIMADAQRSQALQGTPVQIDEPAMTMAQATAVGQDLATRLTDPDLVNDPVAFDQLAQELATYCEDPDVMGTLYDRLGAQGLLDVMNRVAVPPQNAAATIDSDTRESMLIALKSGLNTADTVWPGAQSAAFATALVEASTGDASCSALSYLLHDSYYSDAFLTASAEAIDTFERTGWEGNPGQWSPDTGQGQYWDLYFPDGAKTAYQDPAISLMSALGNNPEVAQGFFAGGPTVTVEISGQDLQVNARLQYYIQDRDWAVEEAEGGALGEALVAASTVLRDQSESGRLSAQIASQTFALIGEKTGQEDDFGEVWEMPAGLRPHVAEMVASYAMDLRRIAGGVIIDDLADGFAIVPRGEWLPDGLPYGASMDKDLMERVIGALGQDEECVRTILAGATAANTVVMSTGFAAEMDRQDRIPAGQVFIGGAPLDGVDHTVRSSATLLGWIVEAAYQGDKASEELTRKRQQMFAEALSAAASLPFIPKIEPATIQWTIDQMRGQAINAFKNGVPQDADDRFTSIDEEVPAGCKDQVMNLLLQEGYFDPESYEGDVVHTPPSLEYSGGDPRRFDFTSDAYQHWFEDSGPEVFLDTRVTVPYNDVWSNL